MLKRKKKEQIKNGSMDSVDIAQNQAEETKSEMKLYILCDNPTNKFKQYIENSGICADKIYESIEQARNELLLEYDTYRLVIVDTGTGKYSGVAQRRDIVDLLGMMDKDCKTSLFYTDEALKQDIRQNTSRDGRISITRYEGTPDLVLEIMRIGERYRGKYKADTKETYERNLKPLDIEGAEKFRYRSSLVSTEDIRESMNSDSNDYIKSYNDFI